MYTIKSSLNVFLICLLVLDSAAAESELPELLLAEVGSNSYCEEELCAAGEGDCDNDSQCESGLVCSNDVGLNYGFRDIVDVCEVPASGSDAYCNGRTCGVGEGDCDSDNQCESGLVCSDDVGAAYGFRAFVDVCELPSSPGMDDAGGDSFCDGRLCGVGEGD